MSAGRALDEKRSISEHEAIETTQLPSAPCNTHPAGAEPKRMLSVVSDDMHNLVYVNEDEEPELHWRTYVALIALFMLNFAQLVALNSPTSILSYIGSDLHNSAQQNWVANSLSLVQAVAGPLIVSYDCLPYAKVYQLDSAELAAAKAFASDTFQARKFLLVGLCGVAVIGAAIAPGSSSIYRVVVAQILIGAGFAAVPLAYAIPSEIVPRRWRPLAQSFVNTAATLGATFADLMSGYLTRQSAHRGWRNSYWVQTGIWGLTMVCLLIGYRPPKRHTRLDNLSLWGKIKRLDLPGMALLTSGLTLLLTGLSLGGNPWPWTNVRVLATLIVGIVILIAFGIYEWRFTATGILHHQLFGNRAFALSVGLIFVEGIMLFAIVIFYPAFTTALYETDPLLVSARIIPFWLGEGVCTLGFGFWSARQRTFRGPLLVGYLMITGGLIGLANIQPSSSKRPIAFVALAGGGFAAPIILLTTLVQLSVPHSLIATGTAVLTSSRAVAAAVFTAIYAAAVNAQVAKWVPKLVPKAAISAGLSPQYAGEFTGALADENTAALAKIPGVTGEVIAAGVSALKQALADSFRVPYIIAASFGVVAVVLIWFVPDMTTLMHYGVDAPVEELHAKGHHGDKKVSAA